MRRSSPARLLASAVLSGILFVACKSTPPAPAVPDDAALTVDVTTKLADDPALANEKIHATVKDGIATLSGSVSSDSQNALVYRDVSGVPGIKDVVNNLSFPNSSGNGALGGSSIPASAVAQPPSTPRGSL